MKVVRMVCMGKVKLIDIWVGEQACFISELTTDRSGYPLCRLSDLGPYTAWIYITASKI